MSSAQTNRVGAECRPKVVDLFCGVGGLSLGFQQAGFDIAAAYDSSQDNVQWHHHNFPDCHTVRGDVRLLVAEDVLDSVGLPDVVVGGPPCQGFSTGGRRDVGDTRNELLREFGRLVTELSPKYFVMENVRGLMSSKMRPFLDRFIRQVKRGGYVVLPPEVLNASDFGVPQRRRRVIVLGYLDGESPPVYPEPTAISTATGRSYTPTVRNAISDIPDVDRFDVLSDSEFLPVALHSRPSHYARLMRGQEPDPLNSAAPRPSATALSGCLRTHHSAKTVRRFRRTAPGERESVSRLFRLDPDGVSPTIRAGTGHDYGGHTAPRPIHYRYDRCITAREAARLHSFPDWFRFVGTRWGAFRQIGNSVPPFLARAIAHSIRAAGGWEIQHKGN